MIRLSTKHFEFLAGAMRSARQIAPDNTPGVDKAAEALADELCKTNAKFDRVRFLNACQHGQLSLPIYPDIHLT